MTGGCDATERPLTFARGLACTVAAATVLTLLMAAPVLVSPSTRLFGWEIDGREPDPYSVIEQFRSGEVPAPYRQPATDLVGRALALLLGPVAALNVVVLVTFPLAAGAAYALARHAGASHAGSMLAGLAYAFSPFHVTQAALHPHIAQTQWFPLYLLALWLCVEDARPGRLVGLAVAASLTVLSNFYAGFILAVLTLPVLVGLWLTASPTGSRGRPLLRTAGALAALALVGTAVIALRAPAVIANPSGFAFPREDLFRYGARGWSYLVPPLSHPILGALARRFWMQHHPPVRFLEQQLTLGWSLLLLASAAWSTVVVPVGGGPAREDERRRTRVVFFFSALAALAFYCSLAPAGPGGSWTLVPSSLFYHWAPMFRAYARFGMIVQLAVAVLAGLGLTAAGRSASHAKRLAAAVLVIALIVEYAPIPGRSRDVLPTQGHRWLAGQPGPLHVFDCVPFSIPEYTLTSLVGHRVSFAVRGAHECDDPDLGRVLARRGVTHLLVRRGTRAGAALIGPRQPPAGLVLVRELDDSLVFAVAPDRLPELRSGLEAP
jgi:hypothetical protein